MNEENTLLIGAHFSIAGGLHKAIDRARELDCNVLQLFTHNPRQWAMSPVNDDDPVLFQKKRGSLIIAAHTSYLINLASGNREVREKSLVLFSRELERAHLFNIQYLILHPGSIGEVDVKAGLEIFARGLDWAIAESGNRDTTILLETTAGHKSSIGQTFEHLAEIISLSKHPGKLGVCFDTCHTFAAGYDIRDEESYGYTIEEFDRIIGLDFLRFFHLNDSKKGLGSHVDRHTHIGDGAIGKKGFSLIMKDKRFSRIGKCLETPKGEGTEYDRMNLAVLRGMVNRG